VERKIGFSHCNNNIGWDFWGENPAKTIDS